MSAPVLSTTGIRTDIVTRLTGQTPAASRVYDSRAVSLDDDSSQDFPAVSVYTLSTRQSRDTGGTWWTRTERVSVVGYVTAYGSSGDADLAANIDEMETAIQDTILSDDEFTSEFNKVESADASRGMEVRAKRRVGTVSVVFELEYSVNLAPADSTLEPLDEIRVTTDTTEPEGADVSTRIIEVDQP